MRHDPAPERLPDEDLVRGTAAGDAEAFGALFHRRRREVYRFAVHMSGDPAVAEDVTQEVFLAVMRDAGRYEPGRASVASWLLGIARNHVRRRLDTDRSLVSLDGPGGDGDEAASAATAGDALSDLVRAERIEALRGAIGTLPLRYREAVVLCDLQEMPYVEAAAAIGCAVGTVRSRLHRGRALLASKLGLAQETSPGPAEGQATREGRPPGLKSASLRLLER